MSLPLSVVIVATIIATSFIQTESYVPRHIYRGDCARIATTSIISRDGCYNNITLPSCNGACTSYEYPVIFNTREAAKDGARDENGNVIQTLVQNCQCCKPVDYKTIPVVDYPLYCPDGSIKNYTMRTRFIYACSCQSCGVV